MTNINITVRSSLASLFAIMGILLGSEALALPGVTFGVMGGGNLTLPSIQSTGVTVSGAIDFSVGPTMSLGPVEGAVLYSRYSLKTVGTGFEVTSASKHLEIPLLYRFGLDLVSLGVGGFYAICIDEGSYVVGDLYGALASIRTKIPGTSIFVDGRFNLGLSSTTGGGKLSSLAFLVGYDFF